MPAPRPGEVLIRVRTAGINRPDILQRNGNYPPLLEGGADRLTHMLGFVALSQNGG